MKILDYIPAGAENAITGRQLQSVTGLDVRTIKGLIANERLHGAVICANLDGGGYFLPRTPLEAVEYVRIEQHRISSAKQALAAAEKYVEGIE